MSKSHISYDLQFLIIHLYESSLSIYVISVIRGEACHSIRLEKLRLIPVGK